MAGRLLLVTSPLLHGADVIAVQRRLVELGLDPGSIDGVYGPATERDPAAVLADLADGKISTQAAATLYGAGQEPRCSHESSGNASADA